MLSTDQRSHPFNDASGSDGGGFMDLLDKLKLD